MLNNGNIKFKVIYQLFQDGLTECLNLQFPVESYFKRSASQMIFFALPEHEGYEFKI